MPLLEWHNAFLCYSKFAPGRLHLRTLKLLFLITSVTLIAAVPALADTELVSRSPKEGAALKQAPPQVKLSFAGPVDAAFSPLEVYDGQGQRVDEDNAGLDPEDPTTLMVDLKDDLSPGSYTVRYRFTGEDGHTITGSYEFAVSKQRDPAEPTTEETTTAPQTVPDEDRERNPADEETTLEAEEQSASEGSGLANTALYVGLAIVALVVVGMLVGRRR